MENTKDKIFAYILDDSKDFIQIVDMYLKEANLPNLEYLSFCDWRDMLETITENTPDLIVADFNLNTRETGIDVLHKVRKINPQCRFIFMSALMTFEELTLLNNEGCGYFINKTKNFKEELLNATNSEKNFIIKHRAKTVSIETKLDKTIDLINKGLSHD